MKRCCCLLIGLAPLLLCGCQLLTYTSPTGERLSRRVIGTSTSLSSLSLEADTNGVRRVELQGYRNEATQALATVTEAAVRAALTPPR